MLPAKPAARSSHQCATLHCCVLTVHVLAAAAASACVVVVVHVCVRPGLDAVLRCTSVLALCIEIDIIEIL